MKVLFVCKHNRFRSKVAEALLKHFDKKKKFTVKSAAINIDPFFPYVAPLVKRALISYGIKSIKDPPTKINVSLIDWADKVVIVADNVSSEIFPESKVIRWSISDCDQSDEEGITQRVKQIYDKVALFIDKYA